jgi:hypothetical protein
MPKTSSSPLPSPAVVLLLVVEAVEGGMVEAVEGGEVTVGTGGTLPLLPPGVAARAADITSSEKTWK